MRHCFAIVILVVAIAIRDSDAALTNYFPPDVFLGMSQNGFESTRINATASLFPLFPRYNHTAGTATDYIERVSESEYIIYLMRDSILRGMVYSATPLEGVPEYENIRAELIEHGRILSEDDVARANGTLRYSPVRVGLWDIEDAGHIYFVATPQETSLILFDPGVLGFSNFFLHASKIPELENALSPINALPIGASDGNDGSTITNHTLSNSNVHDMRETTSRHRGEARGVEREEESQARDVSVDNEGMLKPDSKRENTGLSTQVVVSIAAFTIILIAGVACRMLFRKAA